MRMSRLVTGLVTLGLAGAAPVLVSAPANAVPVGTTVTLSTSTPGDVDHEYNDNVYLTGNVTAADGSYISYGTATLQVQTAANPTWTTVATDTSPGGLSFTVKATSNANYQVVYSGGSNGSTYTPKEYQPGTSAPLAITTARKLTIPPAKGLKITGKVTPDYTKKKVKILQQVGKKKVKKYATVKTNKKGRFSFKAPNKIGFKFIVVIPADAMYRGTYEPFEVRLGF
jgi:hypothetical protein